MRLLRYSVLARLPAGVQAELRKFALALLDSMSFGRGKGVLVAGTYPLQVGWDRAGVDFETWEVAFSREFASRITEKSVVFDVGASIGEWSALAGTLAKSGEIHSFEPDAASWRELFKCFRRNNLVPPKGMFEGFVGSSSSPMVDLTKAMQPKPPLYGDPRFKSLNSESKIATVTLDDYCEIAGVAPDIVKVDVEGAEGEVLRGMEKTAKRYGPIIFLSLHPWALADFGDDKDGILLLISRLGYTPVLLGVDHEEHYLCTRKNV